MKPDTAQGVLLRVPGVQRREARIPSFLIFAVGAILYSSREEMICGWAELRASLTLDTDACPRCVLRTGIEDGSEGTEGQHN